MEFLDRIFRLRENKTNVRTEVLAGLVTFMTMAYIIFVNPAILKDGAGMDFNAVMLATCVSAGLATLLMGFIARYPIALAPGMGLNAFFSYEICAGMGVDWRIALGVVFVSGFVFFILTLVRIREMIVHAIPPSLKFAIAAGIGLFIAFIGLKHAGIIADDPVTLVTIGDLQQPFTRVAIAGVALAAVLMVMRVKGAILISILATGVIGILAGLVQPPFPEDVFRLPPLESAGQILASLVGLPEIEQSAFMKLDVVGLFANIEIFIVPVLVLLFFDMFDTIGTLIGVSEQAGFLDREGRLPRASRALTADSVGTMVGAVMGTSTVTSYVESAAGVAEGGRTGLTNCVTALLFVLAIFFSPVVQMFGGHPFVTAPALLMVGVLMMGNIARVTWADLSEGIPAFLTVVLMPLTSSISHGLAIGFISYPILKLVCGKGRQVHWLVYVLGALFVARYIFLPT